MTTNLSAILRAHGVLVPDLTPLSPDSAEPIWTYPVPRESAAEQWRTLRNLVPETGHWPLLIGGNLKVWQEHSKVSVADDIRQATEINPTIWLAEQATEWDDEDSDWFNPSQWPDDVAPSHGFYFTDRSSSSPKLQMALLPTAHGWESPAWIGLGGWNDCPHPAEQVAMLKYWESKYGAEVVCIDRDVMEMHVSRPPTTREDALALAREQFLYCYDIVAQGTDTIEALAAALLGGTTWFFWWD